MTEPTVLTYQSNQQATLTLPSNDTRLHSKYSNKSKPNLHLTSDNSHAIDTIKSQVSNQDITEARQKRKIIEANVKLLQNRISLLNQEEHRIKKNKEELENKAKSILVTRIQHEKEKSLNNMRYAQVKEMRRDQLNELRESLNETRRKQHEELRKLKEQVLEQKRRDYLQIKEQQKLNEQRMMQAYRENILQQRQKSSKIKQLHEISAIKKEEFFIQKAEMIKEERELTLKQEEELAREREQELLRLSRLEDELLNKVHKAQEAHEKATHDLTDVKSDSVQNLETKYTHLYKKKRPFAGFLSPHNKSSSNTHSFSNINDPLSIGPKTTKSSTSVKSLHTNPQ